MLAACGGGGGSSSGSSGGGGGPQVYQVSGATVVGGFRNVTINWLNPAVGAGNVTAVNITYQIVAVNGPANDKTTLLLSEPLHLISDGATVITHTINPFEPARYTFTIEPVLGGALINATTRAVVFPNVNVIANPDDLDDDGVLNSVDVDDDGDGLIEIYNATQLNMMRHNLAGTSLTGTAGGPGNSTGCAGACNGYELKADINLADYYTNWEPVGTCGRGSSCTGAATSAQLFNATFDGNGYNITNMRIIIENNSYGVGFFGAVAEEVELRNVHIRNANIVVVTNPSTTNVVNVGGLVGFGQKAKISYSSATLVNITGADGNVGGLVGSANGAKIISSYAVVANLTGIENVGGLVGNGRNAEINASYAVVANLTGIENVGGLVGNGGGLEIRSSYAVTRRIINTTTSAGGLIGAGNTTEVMYSYWDNNVTFTGGSEQSDGFGMSKSRSDLQNPTGFSDIYSSWGDFLCSKDATKNAWDLGTDTEYPALACLGLPALAEQRAAMKRVLGY